ncbi:MAG: Abi family protein [Deltaproteobacteria bacterium]|nr:Abi family protein [Deltaproteobacteria bacterium]
MWHKKNNKSIPFWVAVETWDFGVMSKYFTNLNGKYQEKICDRLDVPNKKILSGWLDTINTLRNRCAHHSRIWNWASANAVHMFNVEYFDRLNLCLDARKRVYGLICILWYLVKKIGPRSTWINDVASLIDNKPAIACCPYTSMGFPDNSGFPRDKFVDF